MQLTAGVALSALSAAVSVAVAWFAYRADAPTARAVAAFSAAVAVWAGGNAVQGAVTTLDAKLLAVQAQYVGIAAVPVAWFAFAAAYTDRSEWATPRVLAALAALPAVVLVLSFTNDAHHLVRASAGLEQVGGTVRLDREYGPAFWLLVAYSNLVNGAGTVLLLEGALRVGGHYRRQTVVVLAGATVPWVANVAFLAGATTVEPEAFFGVTALAFGYASARYGLFDLLPVARDRVLAELEDGVVVLDRDGRVADYNPAAERLLDAAVETGAAFDELAPDDVVDALAGGRDEVVAVPGREGTRWLSVDAAAVDGGRGRVVLLRDVTELERQRARLDRENARLERVADTISHDLRNPLNVATGYLELAEESGDDDFQEVRAAMERMDDIIEGTLRLARGGRGDPELADVELAEAARAAWTTVPTDGATLDVAADRTVRADPDQLGSLLENLFRNAVQHGGDGVTVTVGTTVDGFFVADDGVGIPREERATVLERGYTTSEDGTGLGLGIVFDIANAHGWTAGLAASAAGGVRVEFTDVETAADTTHA